MNESLMGVLIILAGTILLGIAFLPTLIAFNRNHRFKWIIFIVNIALGATGIGYLIALVWSFWPSGTAIPVVLMSTPNANTTNSGNSIYNRYGANLLASSGGKSVKDIYVQRESQRYGPYTIEQVRSYIGSGHFSLDDLAWHEGIADWTRITSILEDSVVPIPPITHL